MKAACTECPSVSRRTTAARTSSSSSEEPTVEMISSSVLLSAVVAAGIALAEAYSVCGDFPARLASDGEGDGEVGGDPVDARLDRDLGRRVRRERSRRVR